MAKKKKKAEEQAAEPKPEKRALPKVPKERNPLLKILTILLVLVGVGELALWGYFGFSTFRRNRALREYEAAQQAAAEERAARGITSGSAYGPRFKVENGRITWQREDELPDPGSASSGAAGLTQGESGSGEDTPRIYFPKIPYALAEVDADVQAPTQGAQPLSGGGSSTPA